MIKQLLPYAKKYKLYAFLSPVAMIFEVLLEVFIPLLMSRIIDIGIPNQDMGYIVKTGAFMVVSALLSMLCGVAGSVFSAKAAMGFGTEVRAGLFNKIQDFSFGNIDKFSTASLVTRITTDTQRVQMAFLMVLRIFVRAPVMLVAALIMAYKINPSLMSVFLVAIPLLIIGIGAFGAAAFPRFTAMFEKYDGLNATTQENLMGIRTVKAFVREKYGKAKFSVSNNALMDAAMRAEKITVLGMPLVTLIMTSCIVAVLWRGGKQVIVGEMAIGQLSTFITYITQILVALVMVAMVFVMLVMSRASAKRIFEVLNEVPEITSPESPVTDVKDGSIEFENVSFKYSVDAEKNVLEGINLKINSGETIGIIGATGSAKSSLVHLIPRLYDATGGKVLVGGVDVRDYDLVALRDSVAMVLQNNVLFSGTIEENLRWGNMDATQEELLDASESAQALEFIEKSPDGFDTELGQGGVNVSGGQKQRLTITRALLKNPKVLILDDSTSAVDTATDAKIRSALSSGLKDTTKIIIAQRISSIHDADRILVLDDGKVNAFDTPDNLLKTNKIYQDVYHTQEEGAAV